MRWICQKYQLKETQHEFQTPLVQDCISMSGISLCKISISWLKPLNKLTWSLSQMSEPAHLAWFKWMCQKYHLKETQHELQTPLVQDSISMSGNSPCKIYMSWLEPLNKLKWNLSQICEPAHLTWFNIYTQTIALKTIIFNMWESKNIPKRLS